jgi:hypothetical protein
LQNLSSEASEEGFSAAQAAWTVFSKDRRIFGATQAAWIDSF